MRHVLILFVAAGDSGRGCAGGRASGRGGITSPATTTAAAAPCRPFDTPPFVIVTMRDGQPAARNDDCALAMTWSWRRGGKLSRTPAGSRRENRGAARSDLGGAGRGCGARRALLGFVRIGLR